MIPKMNQIELNDTICSKCHCEDPKFLHHFWDGNKGLKMCTSCILFENKKYFCPTCFDIIVSPWKEECTSCVECKSDTHTRCISGNELPFKCSTCRNGDSLIFDIKELKSKEGKGCYKVMDMKAARLLVTAAKIVKKLISKAHDDAANAALMHARDTILVNEKVKGLVNRFIKFEEWNDGPSLLDTSPETSSETAI
ncbi:hypothetical protein R6Q59_018431 [Mikania micrantha]|uniref:Uncharacterized protein n=1 Tax=Mikania micrantha TaxID=192012 RepID=A0A5N6M0Z8_9ASTR|nr:hypothetical protein E3N88_35427 [Mikania micrantha]